MSKSPRDTNLYPHSPDVLERETTDNGFSSGWGLHFQSSEQYWIDCHVHIRRVPDLQKYVDRWFDWSFAYRQAKLIAVNGMSEPLEAEYSYDELAAAMKDDDRLAFMYYPTIDTQDTEPMEHALELGACGVKLWSPTFMLEGRQADEFEHQKWAGVFKIVNDKQLPIVWHVTQRVTDSPYTGGARNSYWSVGWEKGIKYTNEDLLKSFLNIAKAHPNGHFIGAHQLYMGPERLAEIFEEHPNVYIDSSIGCFVRWGDTMYPEDQKILREFFVKYADRVLFGTDIGVGGGYHLETEHLSLMGHTRFFRQLHLPYEELQKISHGNAEKLFRLEVSSDVRTGNIRP